MRKENNTAIRNMRKKSMAISALSPKSRMNALKQMSKGRISDAQALITGARRKQSIFVNSMASIETIQKEKDPGMFLFDYENENKIIQVKINVEKDSKGQASKHVKPQMKVNFLSDV